MKYLISMILVITLAGQASAKNNGEWDYLDQGTKDWFKSLKNSKGFICCSIADGHVATWKHDEDGFQVLLDNKWYKVPDHTILRKTPNKFGEAIVWYGWKYYDGDGNKEFEVRCFLPESEA